MGFERLWASPTLAGVLCYSPQETTVILPVSLHLSSEVGPVIVSVLLSPRLCRGEGLPECGTPDRAGEYINPGDLGLRFNTRVP